VPFFEDSLVQVCQGATMWGFLGYPFFVIFWTKKWFFRMLLKTRKNTKKTKKSEKIIKFWKSSSRTICTLRCRDFLLPSLVFSPQKKWPRFRGVGFIFFDLKKHDFRKNVKKREKSDFFKKHLSHAP
jgi:hypothetical protein